MARANRQPELANAVAKAFMTAGFSSSDLLTGQITLTDLEWRCPPLSSEETLNGFPISDYLDYPIGADSRALYKFWRNGVAQLYTSSSLVATAQGWRNTGRVARSSTIGERNLRFSVPENFPHHYPFAGHVFTMEVVHTFANSCKVMGDLQRDGSNYWVATEHGDIGIRNGLIIGDTNWTDSMEHMVDVFLESPRGATTTECRYDLISKVRSVLHENAELFPEFTGIDYALQALAKLSQDRLCGSMLNAVQAILPDTFNAKRQITLLDEAVEMMAAWVANDRVKISSLYETLVPAVYSVGAFHREIYNMGRFIPAILQNSTLKKISDNLLKKRCAVLETLGPRDREHMKREGDE